MNSSTANFKLVIYFQMEKLPLEMIDYISKFVAFTYVSFYKEPVVDIRNLIRFSKSLAIVKHTPTYRNVFKMIRTDMLSEVGGADTVNKGEHREYNLSGIKLLIKLTDITYDMLI